MFDGFGDDRGDVVRILFEIVPHLFKVVVVKFMDIAVRLWEDAALPVVLRRRRPFVPAVVFAAQDVPPPGVGARNAHRRLRRAGTCLEEAYLARARDMLYAQFCVFDLLGRDERVAHAAAQLRDDRVVHRLVLIAEQDGTHAHVVIDVFRAVHVPDVRVLAAIDIDRRDALDVRLRPLAVELAAREDRVLRLCPKLVGSVKFAV